MFKIKNSLNNQGQTEVEFMLVLPFFLMMVFTVLLLTILLFSGQMLTYATFWGGRAAAVHGDEQLAASSVLPGVNIDVNGTGKNMTVKGTYTLRSIIGRAGGAIDSPLARLFTLEKTIKMYQFKPPGGRLLGL